MYQPNQPDPDYDYFGDFMTRAADASWVEQSFARNSRFRKGMGFGLKDWDAKAGRFKRGGAYRTDQEFGFMGDYRYDDKAKAFRGLTAEQKNEFASMVESTMTKVMQDRASSDKAAGLLDKIQAKSSVMEDLIQNRRTARETELKQTRGLY